MPFKGRPYDEALADNDVAARLEMRITRLERQRDDLLEACKAIVRAEKGNVIDFFAAVDAAKEAISKAQDT